MTDNCKCLTGNGCRYCRPQEYINILGELIDVEREALAEYMNRRQAEALKSVSLQRPLASINDLIDHPVMELTPEQLAQAWEVITTLEKWSKDIEEEIHCRMLSELPVPGLRLAQVNGGSIVVNVNSTLPDYVEEE